MTKAFFITGTDTNIGKTLVAETLLRLAAAEGRSTLGLKPVSAGCERHDDVWMNDDARDLMLASTLNPAYSSVNPVALREPMAPHIAAEREGITIDCDALAAHCRQQLATADFCVIEGAGGWQVPLNNSHSMADLAVSIGCPVILVVGMRLGCINHTLLTAAAIESAGLKIAGWVANHVDPDMAVATANVTTLKQRLAAPLLGELPWLEQTAAATDYLQLPQ